MWHFVTSTFTLHGRRGTWWHRPSLCVAGVALGDSDLHFAWQAWHLWHWNGSGGPLGYFGRRGCLRGRRGTCWHRPSLGVAGVALGDIDLHFAWQAWHLATATFTCVAGVALGDIDFHFAWHAWHLVTSTFTLRGRCGTWWHGRALCVAGVALLALDWLWWRAWVLWSPRLFACQAWLGDIDLHFAWQVWHLWHWTGSGGALGYFGRRGCLRVKRGLADIDLHFAWQAWHLWHWTGSGGTQNSSTQLCHRFLSHTTLSQHTTLSHTTLSQTTLSHKSFSPTIFYTQLYHIQLFHTQHFNIQTYTHNTVTHTQLFHPTCLAPSPFLPAFPISFSHLLVIIGRSWFVGLSGPLIVAALVLQNTLWEGV